jgi:hypothetical protein
MPAILNPFSGTGYDTQSLTEAINLMPNMYGRVGELGIFREEGVTTTSVAVEFQNNTLNLLPTRPRGAPPTVGTMGKRNLRSFVIPQIPHNDVVMPEEVQNVRAFGAMTVSDTVASKVAQKLQVMKNKHDITKEWMRVGALSGVLLDYDGTTVIYNWFTEFGITQKVIDFNFTLATLDVRGVVASVLRWIEDHMYGEMMNGVHCLCSPEFFDALVSHANVKDAYKYFTTAQQLSQDLRKGFNFAGITFEEYRGTATDPAGTAHKFIAASTAQFFPLGTQQTFRMYNAPADFNETVNTMGLPYYAKQEERDFNRGWDLHTQSNPLAMCARPQLLVKATMS